jgi:hypothetical protein
MDNGEALSAAAQALLTETTSGLTPVDLVHWAQHALPDTLDAVAYGARVPDLSEALAEALAEAGVLPMFEFPTQSRTMHLVWPGPGRESTLGPGRPDRHLGVRARRRAGQGQGGARRRGARGLLPDLRRLLGAGR